MLCDCPCERMTGLNRTTNLRLFSGFRWRDQSTNPRGPFAGILSIIFYTPTQARESLKKGLLSIPNPWNPWRKGKHTKRQAKSQKEKNKEILSTALLLKEVSQKKMRNLKRASRNILRSLFRNSAPIFLVLRDFLGGGNRGGGLVRGTMFIRNGAVTPGLSRECDITFFAKGRPKSARQSRDSTVAARRVQGVTVPSWRVSRECRSPALSPPP